MNSPLGTKNRPWRARVSLMNGESSSTISKGNVVQLNPSDLGQVVLPSTGGVTQAHSLFAGIAANDAPVGTPVEIVAGGYCHQAKFINRTRAASTDDFSSVAACAVGNLLTIDTVNNGVRYSTVGAASLGVNPIVLLESIASIASMASATSNASTAQTQMVKVWVRALV